jgi:hypothetical protein
MHYYIRLHSKKGILLNPKNGKKGSAELINSKGFEFYVRNHFFFYRLLRHVVGENVERPSFKLLLKLPHQQLNE